MKTAFFLLLILCMSIFGSSCSFAGELQRNVRNDNSLEPGVDNYDILDRDPVKGGKLRIFSTKPDTLNPLLSKNSYVQIFCGFIYESLFKIGKDQKPVPVLCESFDVSEDGLIWTFYLKENVKWHDNVSLTAEDVEFSIEKILNIENESIYRTNLQNILTFAALDTYKLRVVLRKPNAFLPGLMTFPIIPKHYFENDKAQEFNENPNPIGTGPFKFVSYKNNEYIKLKANENWWNLDSNNGNGAGKPYIQEIEIKIYEDVKDEIEALMSGQVDVALVQSLGYSSYKGRTDLSVKVFPGRNYEFLAFNLKSPLCAEKAVRQVFERSIDKSEIINEILHGEATIADLPILPTSWVYDSHSGMPAEDKEDARQLLLNDGWKEENGSLYKRINNKKLPLKLEILVNSDNNLRLRIAEKIKEQVKETGIDVIITQVPWEDEFKRINSGKFDMVLMGCTIPAIPDVSFLYSSSYVFPYSANIPDMAKNIAGYFNPKVDEIIDSYYRESDDNEKKILLSNIKELVMEDMPYIGLFFYNEVAMFNKRVRGDIDPYIWDKYNDIIGWYILPG